MIKKSAIDITFYLYLIGLLECVLLQLLRHIFG